MLNVLIALKEYFGFLGHARACAFNLYAKKCNCGFNDLLDAFDVEIERLSKKKKP